VHSKNSTLVYSYHYCARKEQGNCSESGTLLIPVALGAQAVVEQLGTDMGIETISFSGTPLVTVKLDTFIDRGTNSTLLADRQLRSCATLASISATVVVFSFPDFVEQLVR